MINYIISAKKIHLLSVFFAFFFLTVHAQDAKKRSYKKAGTASFYNKKFDGRKTSSGEKLDNHRYTAAHPSIPFGTLVRVTNTKNGKSVVVKINDRFYPRRNHLIDVTYCAAEDIDMISQGMANVTIEVLDITESEAIAEGVIPPDTITFGLPLKKINLPVEKPVTEKSINLK